MWQADLGNGKYRNPILYADYSDPDAIRVGEDYFIQSTGKQSIMHWTSYRNSVTAIRFMAAGYGHRQSGIMKELIIYVFRCRMRAFT